ncbi:hypothetical protein [Hymenobacter cellulosivorans]|uniref:Lipoprotein n=1 Tax=Hymenobacter cellulosivorans TaxID=2932249 RepID=A0ABY4F5S9_9BACT|nr:hypothetical protein [Hymenobacter cellulosivorans]UOQ52011.1 hypothetical protein MUN80_19885 [Hymenobacter cellulosivorans]
MKKHVTWMLAAAILLLGAAGCAEKQAQKQELVVQNASVVPLTGEIISSAQAVSWTTSYQEAYPDEVWAVFTEASVYKQLLAQEKCQGIRLYHATTPQGKNTIVMVGVNDAGADMTKLVADMATPCPPGHYNSILLAKPAEQLLPPTLPAGGMIELDQAAAMTKLYQKQHPAALWAGYYSAYVYTNLLAQPGCIGIRIYRGIKEDKQECFVLVGVDKEGADMTKGLLYDISMPCPYTCFTESELMLQP